MCVGNYISSTLIEAKNQVLDRKVPKKYIYSWKSYFMKIKTFSQQIKFLTHDALK